MTDARPYGSAAPRWLPVPVLRSPASRHLAAQICLLAILSGLAGLATFGLLDAWGSRTTSVSAALFAAIFLTALGVLAPVHVWLRERFHLAVSLRRSETDLTLGRLLAEMTRSSDLVQLVGHALATIVHRLDLAGAALLFAPDDRRDFVLADARGARPATVKLAFDDPLVAVVGALRTAVTREAVENDPRYAHVRRVCLDAFAALGVDLLFPVEAGDSLVGILALKRSSTVALDPVELDLLRTLAAEIGLSVIRTRDTEHLRRARREIERLGRFLPRSLAADVSAGRLPGGSGRRRAVTVVVAIVHGLDELADSAEPEEIMQTLARYHMMAVTQIARESGTVARIHAGMVVAVFGDPDPVSDHARRAVRMAARLAPRAQAIWQSPAYDDPPTARTSFGVATGFATVGFVESDTGPSYHVLGRLVGQAEALARADAAGVLVSDATMAAAGAGLKTTRVAVSDGSLTGARSVSSIDGFAVDATRSPRKPPAPAATRTSRIVRS